jgi:hypothetical protein
MSNRKIPIVPFVLAGALGIGVLSSSSLVSEDSTSQITAPLEQVTRLEFDFLPSKKVEREGGMEYPGIATAPKHISELGDLESILGDRDQSQIQRKVFRKYGGQCREFRYNKDVERISYLIPDLEHGPQLERYVRYAVDFLSQQQALSGLHFPKINWSLDGLNGNLPETDVDLYIGEGLITQDELKVDCTMFSGRKVTLKKKLPPKAKRISSLRHYVLSLKKAEKPKLKGIRPYIVLSTSHNPVGSLQSIFSELTGILVYEGVKKYVDAEPPIDSVDDFTKFHHRLKQVQEAITESLSLHYLGKILKQPEMAGAIPYLPKNFSLERRARQFQKSGEVYKLVPTAHKYLTQVVAEHGEVQGVRQVVNEFVHDPLGYEAKLKNMVD